MKYVVILGDGMADYPIDKLNNRTPLQVAYKPNIDFLSANGEMGLVKTVPDSLKPGSDTANLSAMGFNPEECYTGRSPLEAISMGIKLKDTDIAVRCNLVTLSNDKNYNDKTMVDYSGGEIDTESARILIDYIDKKFKSENYKFYGGFAYRHCLVVHNTVTGSKLTPPHDITDKKIGSYLPEGLNGQMFYDLMAKSYDLLMEHTINKQRISEGKKPANSIWLWGEGVKPKLKDFYKTYGLKGAVISAVDLIKGIGLAANMNVIDVKGATGYIDTNYQGKADAAIKALKDGYDYVYIHIEAPDECGHRGEIENKIKAIEDIDKYIVGSIFKDLKDSGEDFTMMVMPDHPTPISLKTHTRDMVPFLIYRNNDIKNNGLSYNENTALKSGIKIDFGYQLMLRFLGKNL